MGKRTGKGRRKQGLRAEQLDHFKNFQEPKTIDELLGIFADHGEEIEVEQIEAIFRQSGRDRMSVLDVTAWLIDRRKGGAV
jgi:hypothetical protein